MDKPTRHYATLGVSRNATPAQIRSAFRRLTKIWFPDVNSSSEAKEQWLAIRRAYEVLSDKDKRESYDKIGDAPDPAAVATRANADPAIPVNTQGTIIIPLLPPVLSPEEATFGSISQDDPAIHQVAIIVLGPRGNPDLELCIEPAEGVFWTAELVEDTSSLGFTISTKPLRA